MPKLTKAQAANSLRRVVVFFKPNPQETRDYVEAIWEQFQNEDPKTFDEMCQRLVLRMEPFKRPVPSEFIEVRDEGKKTAQNWKGCENCDRTGFITQIEQGRGAVMCDCHPMYGQPTP